VSDVHYGTGTGSIEWQWAAESPPSGVESGLRNGIRCQT
jgi:hypothetical protein